MSLELDELDRLAASVFDGYLVRKDLVRKYSRQYPVPTYVVEFLLGRYCASTDEQEIREGLAIVEKQLQDRTVRTGEEELFKARAQDTGPVKLIDIVRARLDAKNDCYVAELPSLALRDVRIDDDLVRDNERMLTDGFYAEVTLAYDGIIAQETRRPAIRDRRAAADPDVEVGRARRLGARRGRHSRPRSGSTSSSARSASSPPRFDERAKRVALLRMVPFVERNYNLVELGPRGTGKSHLFQQISPYAHLISGGKATVAKMFVNNATGQRGLGLPVRRRLLRRGVRHLLRPEGRRQHHEGLHGVGPVQPRQGEHPRRGRHRHGRQLRRRRRAAAAGRAPAEPAAAGDAQRHGVHGSPPRLCARLGLPEAEPQRTSHRSLRPGQRLPQRVLEPSCGRATASRSCRGAFTSAARSAAAISKRSTRPSAA